MPSKTCSAHLVGTNAKYNLSSRSLRDNNKHRLRRRRPLKHRLRQLPKLVIAKPAQRAWAPRKLPRVMLRAFHRAHVKRHVERWHRWTARRHTSARWQVTTTNVVRTLVNAFGPLRNACVRAVPNAAMDECRQRPVRSHRSSFATTATATPAKSTKVMMIDGFSCFIGGRSVVSGGAEIGADLVKGAGGFAGGRTESPRREIGTRSAGGLSSFNDTGAASGGGRDGCVLRDSGG
jgi:hypothetical protein